MSAAVVLQIADAVVDRLNSATLSIAVQAERLYVPVSRPEDLVTLRVTVVPRELSMATLSRRDDDFDYVIDVALQVKLVPDVVRIDPYLRLAEEILDQFRGVNLVFGGPYDDEHSARCVVAAQQPLFVPDHIDQFNVLTTVVSLTFRLARPR